MKHILIFVLLLSACGEIDNNCPKFPVTISPALPIQFWSADCETYNEKEVCGVYPKCFFQAFECDDDIHLQFTELDPEKEYSLRVLDEDDNVVDTLQFARSVIYGTDTEFQFDNNSYAVSLTNWQQYAGGSGDKTFVWNNPSSALSLAGPGNESSTTLLYQNRVLSGVGGFNKYPPGDYQFRIRVKNSTSGGSAPLEEMMYIVAGNVAGFSLDATNTPLPRNGTYTEYLVDLTLTDERTYIGVGFYKQGPSAASLINVQIDYFEIVSYPQDYSTSVFDIVFTADDISSCGDQVRFQIVDEDNVVVAKSDYIKFGATTCTNLIEYSNNRNFAGLIYNQGVTSPEQDFKIRVPSVLFHENFPQEDTVMELTSGIIKLTGVLTAERRFETGYLPYYMHRKLILIFEHQNVFIDNLFWTKQNKYEIAEGNKRYPIKMGSIMLTEKDFVQRTSL